MEEIVNIIMVGSGMYKSCVFFDLFTKGESEKIRQQELQNVSKDEASGSGFCYTLIARPSDNRKAILSVADYSRREMVSMAEICSHSTNDIEPVHAIVTIIDCNQPPTYSVKSAYRFYEAYMSELPPEVNSVVVFVRCNKDLSKRRKWLNDVTGRNEVMKNQFMFLGRGEGSKDWEDGDVIELDRFFDYIKLIEPVCIADLRKAIRFVETKRFARKVGSALAIVFNFSITTASVYFVTKFFRRLLQDFLHFKSIR